MLKSVQVRNASGVVTATLPVGIPTSSQDYFIKNIEGLGPTDAYIAMSTFANYDGSVYHASRATARNIIMTVGYSPSYATVGKNVSSLRKDLYGVFRPKSLVELRFVDSEHETLKIMGYVEKATPNVFSKDPQFTVSILCEDAHFSSLTNTILPTLSSWSRYPMATRVGDAEIGFVLDMDVTTAFSYARIIPDTAIDYDIRIYYDFLVGDHIRVSTVPGSKSATVTRNGVTTSLLDSMKGYTLIGVLEPTSGFQLQAAGGNSYSLTLMPKWLGV